MANSAPTTSRQCEFCDRLFTPPKVKRGHPPKGKPITTCSEQCQRRLEVANEIRLKLGKVA